jgi:hypothetical protein
MQSPVHVGVSFCGNTTDQAKLLIDRVKDYTNLFVLQSGPISKNETATREICVYAVNSGLRIMCTYNRSDWQWKIQFFNSSREKYGDRFLGVYYEDDPAFQIDGNYSKIYYWNQTI